MKKIIFASIFVAALSVVQAEEFAKFKKDGMIQGKQGNVFLPKNTVLPIKLVRIVKDKVQVEELENLFKIESNKVVEFSKMDIEFETIKLKNYNQNLKSEEIVKLIQEKKINGVEEYLAYRRLFILEGKNPESKYTELLYKYFTNNKEYLAYTISLPEFSNVAYTYHPLLVMDVVKVVTFSDIMAFGKANGINYEVKNKYEEEIFYEIAKRKMLENKKNIIDVLTAMKYMLPQANFENILRQMEGKAEFAEITKYLRVLAENDFNKNIEYIKNEKNIFLIENMLSELIKTNEEALKYKEELKKRNIKGNIIFEFLPAELKMQEYNVLINKDYELLKKKYTTGGIINKEKNTIPDIEEKYIEKMRDGEYKYEAIEKNSRIALIQENVFANLFTIFGELYTVKEIVGPYPNNATRTLEMTIDNAIEQKSTASEYEKVYLLLGMQKITDAAIERMAGIKELDGLNFLYLNLYDKLGKNTEISKNSRAFFMDLQAKRIVTMVFSMNSSTEFIYSETGKKATYKDIEKEIAYFNNIFPEGSVILAEMLDRAYGNAIKNLEIYEDVKYVQGVADNIELARKILNKIE